MDYDDDDDDDDDDEVMVDDDVKNSETVAPLQQQAASDKSNNVNSSNNGQKIDVSALARAINTMLESGGDPSGVGYQIAETHDIEVTTAGASDEVRGEVMFRAYRGFDVVVQHRDPKQQQSDKIKTVTGKLVERNDEFTVVNIKGRMKHIKNSHLVSVKLPKAKKEKGAR